MASFDLLSMIEKKKHGEALSEAEIRSWISHLVLEDVPAYQTAALLMAIRLQGMTFEETLWLTQAMVESGDTLSFDGYDVLCDKHSTGGIGDKVTLILAPILAACGLPVTMLSGRALGFSGGTIDKFESLRGVSCQRNAQDMQAMLKQVGWANAQATTSIAPADRILYAMRDVTGTVDSIPLITASILSKKLAGGATHLCLDVKAGTGAFMPDEEQATALAENLHRIGEMGGLEISGLVTRMNEPLGHAVGNYLELMESVAYLRNEVETPLMELVYCLGESMLQDGKLFASKEDARAAMRATIEKGTALEKLVGYLRFNGGEEDAINELLNASYEDFARVAICAPADGYIKSMAGRNIGFLAVDLGGGRKRAEDVIDPIAGFLFNKHLGEFVKKGEPIVWAYGEKASSLGQEFEQRVLGSFEFCEDKPADVDLILSRF